MTRNYMHRSSNMPTLLHAKGKLNKNRHAKWLEFIETFWLVIKYKLGKEKCKTNVIK